MALKAQKELEQRVHEEFYKNVQILTLIHSPSKEFEELFHKDMFVKNNKAGFHHVVYYLLNILDHDKLMLKVPIWPLYNKGVENQFRNEMVKYINELNSLYEDAKIPPLAASQLISPGGFRFVKFIFKLSQLVLYEQLKRNCPSGMLLPLQASATESVTVENLKNLKTVTKKINKETSQIWNEFEKQFDNAELEAQKIVGDQQEATKLIKENRLKLALLQENSNKQFDSEQEQDCIMVDLQKKLETLKKVKESFEECNALRLLVRNTSAMVENTELKVPLKISHVVHYEGEALDISSLLEGCIVLNNQKRLEIKSMKDDDVVKQIERFDMLNEQFVAINQDLEQACSDLVNTSEKIQDQDRRPVRVLQMGIDSDSQNSTPLALPLPLSPNSLS